MLNKNVAGILAIILGGFGVHRFYLGQRFLGVVRFLAFVFTLLVLAESRGPAEEVFGITMGMLFLSAFIEGIVFLFMPRDRFDKKYNNHHSKVSAPENIADLKAEGVDYFKSHDYDLAIEAFRDALAVNAADPGIHFNLACCYSKTHDLIGALHHLELSISYGLPEPRRIDKHPALEWLRAQPAFTTFRQQNYRQQLLLNAPLASNASNSTNATTEEPALELPSMEDSLSPDDDLVDQIRKLGKLREMGILTEAEFAEQKEKLLA